MKFLDVQVLAADGALQVLDFSLQLGHLLLTRHRGLDGGNIPIPMLCRRCECMKIRQHVLNKYGDLLAFNENATFFSMSDWEKNFK